jgi:hypothetical protein
MDESSTPSFLALLASFDAGNCLSIFAVAVVVVVAAPNGEASGSKAVPWPCMAVNVLLKADMLPDIIESSIVESLKIHVGSVSWRFLRNISSATASEGTCENPLSSGS